MASFIISILLVFSATTSPKEGLDGLWVRDTDKLSVNIRTSEDAPETHVCNIVAEGNHDFPCDVTSQLIYKNIIKRQDNLWTCDYLVVTINDCTTEYYYDGKMQITEEGKLRVICPGFETMYYSRKNPRYDTP